MFSMKELNVFLDYCQSRMSIIKPIRREIEKPTEGGTLYQTIYFIKMTTFSSRIETFSLARAIARTYWLYEVQKLYYNLNFLNNLQKFILRKLPSLWKF